MVFLSSLFHLVKFTKDVAKLLLIIPDQKVTVGALNAVV